MSQRSSAALVSVQAAPWQVCHRYQTTEALSSQKPCHARTLNIRHHIAEAVLVSSGFPLLFACPQHLVALGQAISSPMLLWFPRMTRNSPVCGQFEVVPAGQVLQGGHVSEFFWGGLAVVSSELPGCSRACVHCSMAAVVHCQCVSVM